MHHDVQRPPWGNGRDKQQYIVIDRSTANKSVEPLSLWLTFFILFLFFWAMFWKIRSIVTGNLSNKLMFQELQ